MRLFCFGLGYSAAALVRRLRDRAEVSTSIAGTTRSGRSQGDGIAIAGFDGTARTGEVTRLMEGTTHLLLSAPPGAAGDPVLACHADDIARLGTLRWIGYLSTVGVYGDHGGAWVDETTEPRPISARSIARLAAETAWLEFGHRLGVPTQVFRLAGIYGPGRSAIDDLRDGSARRIVKRAQVFNRIHVDDIAAALEAAMTRPCLETVFNVADDEPAPSDEVVAYAASLIGVPAPPPVPFDEAVLSPMARSFYGECKRVRNERVKRALGVRLSYPTYREGLAAVAVGRS